MGLMNELLPFAVADMRLDQLADGLAPLVELAGAGFLALASVLLVIGKDQVPEVIDGDPGLLGELRLGCRRVGGPGGAAVAPAPLLEPVEQPGPRRFHGAAAAEAVDDDAEKVRPA